MTRRSGIATGAALGLALVLAVGWLTGLRGALHGLLLSSIALAFLPFVLTLAAVLLLTLVAFVVALAGDEILPDAGAGEALLIGGKKLAKVYYGVAWQQRKHPLGWGLAIGVALGLLGIWAFLWVAVIPREERSLTLLLDAQHRIDAIRRTTGHFPAPAADGLLAPSVLEGPAASSNDAPLLDAFARPLHYRRDGNRFTAAYTLWSRGFDPDDPDDDICVGGRTKLRALLDELHFLQDLLTVLQGGTLGPTDRAAVLLETRCSPPRP